MTIGAQSGILARLVSLTDRDVCISHDFVVGSQVESCRFYSEATLPENRAAQACDGHCGPITTLSCTQRRCGESPRSKFQRMSTEDLKATVLGQAVNQSAEMRSALEFFATAQMFIIHNFNTVHPFSVVVTASMIHGILA